MRWNPVWGYYNQREKKEWEIDFIVVVEISNGVGGGAPLRPIDISTQTTAPNPVDDDGPPTYWGVEFVLVETFFYNSNNTFIYVQNCM